MVNSSTKQKHRKSVDPVKYAVVTTSIIPTIHIPVRFLLTVVLLGGVHLMLDTLLLKFSGAVDPNGFPGR